MVTAHTPAAEVGAFEFEKGDESENFNLRPRDNRTGPIPDEQRRISHDVYQARNILKLLKEQGAFPKEKEKGSGSYHEFIKRVVQAARVGCIAPRTEPKLAEAALEQIRADIVRRKGRPLVYRYLACFAGWAMAGVGVAIMIVIAARFLSLDLIGYGWVLMGAMGGAWLSTAARRWEIAFEDIRDFVDVVYEPMVRVLFVGMLALIFALFLNLALISVKVGGVDFADFIKDIRVALALGLIAGIGEKALSVQLLDRAKKVLGAPSKAAGTG